MRHEIGVESIAFGRDYPHTEGTWPNTDDYLHDLFAGLPEGEVRLMLGENLIDFLGLDRVHLQGVADRIGYAPEQIINGPTVEPRLLAHFDVRAGYLKPAESANRIVELDEILRADLAMMAPGT
jgi:hypothetical protein